MTITINLSPELERALQETSAARGIPAEQIVVGALSESLNRARAQPRLPPRVSTREEDLLATIHVGLPKTTWDRYHELIARPRAETLTEEEHAELIQLSDRVEAMNVSRLEKLVELANLRGVKLETLMDQLGIRNPAYD